MADTLHALPDAARVWIFASAEPLPPGEVDTIRSSTQRFLEAWAAHGAALQAGCRVDHDRFLVIALDERRTGASGCSIDALMAHVRLLEETGPAWLHSRVLFRDASGEIRAVGRGEFKRRAAAGDVDLHTTVFDLTIETLGQLRAGELERPAGETWHRHLIETVGRREPASAP